MQKTDTGLIKQKVMCIQIKNSDLSPKQNMSKVQNPNPGAQRNVQANEQRSSATQQATQPNHCLVSGWVPPDTGVVCPPTGHLDV